MNLLDYLQKQSQEVILTLAIVLILCVGVVDYLTGFEVSFSVFYLLPIALIAWIIHDFRVGVAASIIGAIVWLLVDFAGGRVYSSGAIPFWNAGVRLSFFLIVSYALSSLRAARVRQVDLANFIVHDLRSPLSNILTGLKYMLHYSDEELAPEQKSIAEIGLASSEWMMTLVNSLLDLAKLESGQLTPNMEAASVQALFDRALEQVSAMAVNNDIEVISEVGTGAELVLADSELVVRILVNLVSNALKYSPQEAIVTLKAALYENNKIVLSITDKGAGIPKRWAKDVFNKFAQVEARKASVGVGTGLGLTFCKMAVEAQGGRIWLESEVGQGTSFFFTLPKAPD